MFKRVLILDDDNAMREAMRIRLQHLGQEFHSFDHTRGAIEALATLKFDLIISDFVEDHETEDWMGLPSLVFQKAVALYAPETPVVFCSGYVVAPPRWVYAYPNSFFLTKSGYSQKGFFQELFETLISLPRREGVSIEDIYREDENQFAERGRIVIVDTQRALVEHFARNPELMRKMDSRQFEFLIRDILREHGYEAEATKGSRDGGVDIYACLRNPITSHRLLVECKRYAPSEGVGIGVVQRLRGIQHTKQADKAMIVTTSFFTAPAIAETKSYPTLMDLKDYEDLKKWLAPFRSSNGNPR